MNLFIVSTHIKRFYNPVFQKLEHLLGKKHYLTAIVRDILARNEITIQDGISKSGRISQKAGVLQGDPLSPLLFSIATADVTQILEGAANMYIYADDMALTAQSCETLQDNFHRLAKWAGENDLQLNEEKTVHMTFRRGGRPATNERIEFNDRPLTNVNSFKYLGVTLQCKGN